MRLSLIITVCLVLLLTTFISIPTPVLAATNATTTGTLSLLPSFENISVISSFSGDDNGNNQATLEYRQTGTSEWKPGIAMTVDRRDTLVLYGSGSIANTYKNQARAVIFWLTPNTSYDVRVTYSDADGVSGTNPVTSVVTTRNDNPPSTGNTYYVATTGSDTTGNGSTSNPWKTISKAATMVAAGDTVRIKPGTYNEQVVLSKSGTADNYITYTSDDPGNMAVITSATSSGNFRLSNISYNRLDSLNITNTLLDTNSLDVYITGAGSVGNIIKNCVLTDDYWGYWSGGVIINNGPSRTLVENNTIITTAPHAGGDGPMGVAMYFAGEGTVIRNNTMTGHFQDGVGGEANFGVNGGPYLNGYIHGNTITGIDDDGIEAEGGGINCAVWSNTVNNSNNYAGIAIAPCIVGPMYVFRNIIHSGQAAVKLGSSSYGYQYWYHNTIYTNHDSFASFGSNAIIDNAVFKNNIIQCLNGNYCVEELSGGTGHMVFNYNSMHTTTSTSQIKWLNNAMTWANWRTNYGQEANGIWGDAKVTSSTDMHLQPDSPCIDKGAILVGFNDANSPWPYQGSAPDIGAYESAPPAPAPPVLASIGNKPAHPGVQLQFTISATDPNGDTLTYSANNTPAGSVFTAATRTFTWTPTANQTGSYPNVRFAVTDGTFTDFENITITVTVNQAPELTNPGNKSVNENSALTFTVSAADPDGDTLTYSASNLPSGANFNPTSRTFSWTPSYSQAGTYANVSFRVNDGQFSDSENITITVNNVNRAPVLAAIGNKTVNEGQTLSFAITATDPDGTTPTYSASNLPSGSSFDGTTRVFTWMPSSAQVGTHAGVRFTASDGERTDYEDITITVTTTVVVNPPSVSSGGGGGGGGGPVGITSLMNSMTLDGVAVEEISATDINSKIELRIPKGTVIKNRMGQIVSYVKISIKDSNPAISAGSRMIGPAYDIEQSGTTFDSSAFLVCKYTASDIPSGVPLENLYIALWDPDTNKWIDLGGTVDPDARTVTVSIQHLSTYALMAHTLPADIAMSEINLTSDEINPGETVTASVVLNNQGDLPGEYALTVKLDDTTVQTKCITVNGGCSETIDFAINPDTIGEHKLSIGNMMASVLVKKPLIPASFTFTELIINPLSTNTGENVNVSVLVSNTGDIAGTYKAILTINDVAIESQDVTLDGSCCTRLGFSFCPDTSGQYKVGIGGLVAPFEVKAPVLLPPPAKGSGPEIDSFSTAPGFDPATNKLVYTKVVYKMNREWETLDQNRLVLTVFLNGEFLEQVPLLTLSQLQADGKTGVLDYIPTDGWEVGEYTFRAELYQGENLLQDTPLEGMTVTSESTTAVVSWKTMGIIISCVVVLGGIILTLVLYIRRNTLRDYWK